jgi:hypothetical protein
VVPWSKYMVLSPFLLPPFLFMCAHRCVCMCFSIEANGSSFSQLFFGSSGFELRAKWLLGGTHTTWATPPALFFCIGYFLNRVSFRLALNPDPLDFYLLSS